MSEFKPGDMVECMKAPDNSSGFGWERVPQVGGRYTIRTVEEYLGGIGLRLNEIVNPPMPYRRRTAECSFLSVNFRLIKPRATDISIFKEIVEREFWPDKKERVRLEPKLPLHERIKQ